MLQRHDDQRARRPDRRQAPGSGYKRGTTGDYTDQQRADLDRLLPAQARRQAREIGRELNISELRAMDAETQALAGQDADVAVVVGSDKAP